MMHTSRRFPTSSHLLILLGVILLMGVLWLAWPQRSVSLRFAF